MQADAIVAQPPATPQPIPTLAEILGAPEDQWRALAAQADADPAFIARLRASQANPKRKRTRRTAQRSRPSRSTRHFIAASVLHYIAPAMVEALDCANTPDATLITFQRVYDILNRGRAVAPDKINDLLLHKIEHLDQTTMDALGLARESLDLEALIEAWTGELAIIAYVQHLISDPDDGATYEGWQKGTGTIRQGKPKSAGERQACLDQHFVQEGVAEIKVRGSMAGKKRGNGPPKKRKQGIMVTQKGQARREGEGEPVFLF
jgi:hypothetical protein